MTIQSQSVEVKRRGRPAGTSKKAKNVQYVPSIIDFSQIDKLKNIKIDPKMMETMKSGLPLDELISHEGGVPCASNIFCIGDPGVGKTTVLLDLLSAVKNKGRKVLFVSAEMGRKQMYKYTQRFPQFGNVDTLFMSDYTNYNTKDVMEQILDKGYDLVLIDSVAEVLDSVREDNNWDRKLSESWLVDICVKHNKGENKLEKYTSFLLIQQVTKGGDFVGSNKLKHLTDAMMEIRKGGPKEPGDWMRFQKNRNGNAMVKFGFQLTNTSIHYGTLVAVMTEEELLED